MLRGVVIARRAFSSNGGDRVLEHQMIDAIDLDDDGEPIEVLDATLEDLSIHEANLDDESLSTRGIEEHVLDVGGR